MEGCGAFFYDDWSWIEFRRPGLHAMLASYNQHLVFAPVAAYQLLFATVGLAHDWPHWLLAAVAHLAWATAVFAYARRRIGPAALLLAAPVVFLGAGWEAVLQGFNTEIMASLARGAAALLALDRGARRGDVAARALLAAGLVFGEFVALFAVGVEVTWRDRSLRRAWIWAVALALYAVWWIAYYEAYLSHHDLSLVPKVGGSGGGARSRPGSSRSSSLSGRTGCSSPTTGPRSASHMPRDTCTAGSYCSL